MACPLFHWPGEGNKRTPMSKSRPCRPQHMSLMPLRENQRLIRTGVTGWNTDLQEVEYYLDKRCLKEGGCSAPRAQREALTSVVTLHPCSTTGTGISDKFKRHAGGSSDNVHQNNYAYRKAYIDLLWGKLKAVYLLKRFSRTGYPGNTIYRTRF